MKQSPLEAYQATFLVIVQCFGCLGAVSPIGSKLGHDIWLLMLPVGLLGLGLYFFYAKLLNSLQGRDLAQISLQAFGPSWGKGLIACYLICFLAGASYFLVAIIDLWMLMDMGRTPFFVYVLLVLLTCLLTCRLGLAALGRMVGFFVLAYFLIALIDTLLLLPEMQWTLILPLRVGNISLLLADSWYVCVLLFGLLPLSLTWLPLLRKPGSGPKCLGLGLAVVFADLLMANLRNVLLLGEALRYEDYPSYQALRLVEWGSGILRFELFGELAALSMVLLFAALAFWGCQNLLSALWGRDDKLLLLPLAVLSALLMMTIKANINFIDNSTLLLIFSLAAVIIIVLLLATILKLQKSDCESDQNSL